MFAINSSTVAAAAALAALLGLAGCGNGGSAVETRDRAHIRELHRALRQHGFPLAVVR